MSDDINVILKSETPINFSVKTESDINFTSGEPDINVSITDEIEFLDPRTIPNLVLWLDASDEASVTKDGANKVSSWIDKSGNNQHRNQTNAANQPLFVKNSPINNKPAIQFAPGAVASGDTWLGINASTINAQQNLTNFTVVRIEGATVWGSLFSLCNNASDGPGTPSLAFENNLNDRLITYNTALTTTTKVVLNTTTAILGSNNAIMYRRSGGTNGNGGTVNLESRGGVNVANQGTQNWTALANGNNYYIARQGASNSIYRSLNGYIAEHLCFQRALTADEQTKIWNYLRLKWGI